MVHGFAGRAHTIICAIEKNKFLEAFSAHVPKKKSVMYLMSLQQKPGEWLKQYIEQLKATTQEVRDLLVRLTTSDLLNGTTYAPLRKSPAFFKPKSTTNLFARASNSLFKWKFWMLGK